MLRFWLITTVVIGLAQTDLFHKDITGDLGKEYNNCYLCWDLSIPNANIKTLKIKHYIGSQTETTELCCGSPISNVVRPDGSCGAKQFVRFGDRSHVRSVFSREYPWRAWIYIKSKILCGGTVIDSKLNFILTSASCVYRCRKLRTTRLLVAFSRALNEEILVRDIIIHEDHNPSQPFINDIALLVLNKKYQCPPHWVKPVCRSNRPPMPGTSCTFMSDEDYFIDTLVPMKEQCESYEFSLHESQICSAILRNDYVPEVGGGLFCQDMVRSDSDEYYISGIVLQVYGDMIVHTNVSHYEKWMDDKIKNVSIESGNGNC